MPPGGGAGGDGGGAPQPQPQPQPQRRRRIRQALSSDDEVSSDDAPRSQPQSPDGQQGVRSVGPPRGAELASPSDLTQPTPSFQVFVSWLDRTPRTVVIECGPHTTLWSLKVRPFIIHFGRKDGGVSRFGIPTSLTIPAQTHPPTRPQAALYGKVKDSFVSERLFQHYLHLSRRGPDGGSVVPLDANVLEGKLLADLDIGPDAVLRAEMRDPAAGVRFGASASSSSSSAAAFAAEIVVHIPSAPGVRAAHSADAASVVARVADVRRLPTAPRQFMAAVRTCPLPWLEGRHAPSS